jgi:hypothetical protein
MLTDVQKGKGMKLIIVVSMIGMGMSSYIPTAYAATNNQSNISTMTEVMQNANLLSNLEIKGTQLDKAFLPEENEYSAIVENSVQNITLLIEAENSEANITINGQSFISGTTEPFSLQTGENIFQITVNDRSHPANTYKLTVTRKQSNNNLLQAIKLSKGELSPKFDSAITEYNVQISNEIDSITVTPETINKTANTKVNDNLLKDEGISVMLPVGKSDIKIMVTAENGDVKLYSIHVLRAEKQELTPVSPPKTIPNTTNPKGSNSRINSMPQTSMQQNSGTIQKTSSATLSSLTVSEGTWDSTFSTNEFTYHVAVASDQKSVTINPSATYGSAAISIQGTSDRTFQLTGTKTVISVLVTRGEDRKTYVLVFDKPVQQADITTETTQQSAPSNLSSSSSNAPSITSTTPTSTPANEVNVRKSKPSTSFWGRIVAFFKKIF